MQLPVLTLPQAVPIQNMRPPQETIPQARAERERLRLIVQDYVERVRPVPPLGLEDLRRHADDLIAEIDYDSKYRDYVAVLINSEVWRESLASVPYERRLLLLPKCLRVEDRCPAPFDELGLLCKQCGLCTIQDLQNEAERLGYAVLVAEGSAIVMAMIETGRIEAIVGVSCLSVLEKAFPYMESAAIPGVAVPLLQDDCHDTNLDIEWLWDVIHLTSDDKTYRLDLDGMRREVETWFETESLERLMGPATSETERIGRKWLARSGKRWRPFLTVCAYRALQENGDFVPNDDLRRLAIAVECFHKASLIHDDIEDGDDLRYGEPAVHVEHGVPVALNVGDLLLGEGYRLIAECDAPAEVRGEMLKVAAAGHRTLCLGQGAEMCWARKPRPLASLEVLDIFRQKTSPAFEVALRIGAAYAGADRDVHDVLRKYSEALGIAYQIRDDLDDLTSGDQPDDLAAQRPSLPLAFAHEKARDEDKVLLDGLWRRALSFTEVADHVQTILVETGVEDRCHRLLESYKEETVRSLAALENPSLKGLLRRVVGKIFSVEVKGWCREFEARNAAGSPVGAEAAG